MKIIDCITYFNEKTLVDLRFNILDKFIDKFVIAEAAYTHSGNKKKINFNINDYPKFKHKISHIIIDKNTICKPTNVYTNMSIRFIIVILFWFL